MGPSHKGRIAGLSICAKCTRLLALSYGLQRNNEHYAPSLAWQTAQDPQHPSSEEDLIPEQAYTIPRHFIISWNSDSIHLVCN